MSTIPEPVPSLRSTISGAVARFRFVKCEHVSRDKSWFICAQHPAIGFLCSACSALHVKTHSMELEFQCDECGALDRMIRPLEIEIEGPKGVAQMGGRRPVCKIVSLGLCGRCHRNSQTLLSFLGIVHER